MLVVFLSVGIWLSDMGLATPGQTNGRAWTAWFVLAGLATVLAPPFVGGAAWGAGIAHLTGATRRPAAITGSLAFGGMIVATAAPTDATPALARLIARLDALRRARLLHDRVHDRGRRRRRPCPRGASHSASDTTERPPASRSRPGWLRQWAFSPDRSSPSPSDSKSYRGDACRWCGRRSLRCPCQRSPPARPWGCAWRTRRSEATRGESRPLPAMGPMATQPTCGVAANGCPSANGSAIPAESESASGAVETS